MKWKLTGQFLFAIIVTILLSLFVFLAVNVFIFYTDPKATEKYLPYLNPGTYTLDFEEHVKWKNDGIFIDETHLKELKEVGLWIQVLDENGTEIYSRFKPEEAPEHYTPGELIFYHKYTGALEKSTIFVGILERGGRKLSYIMGFPESKAGKAELNFRPETVLQDMGKILLVMVIAVTMMALLFGYILSRRLTSPLVKMAEGIQSLAKGDFGKKYTPKGLYKDVFQNLNDLSATLQENEAERIKLERIREDWVTNITHDIKTPLASIKGYSEVLLDPEYKLSDREREEYSRIILAKSEYIGHLIEDLNMTYQLKSATFPVKKESENLVELVRESVIQILNDPRYQDACLEFTADLEEYSIMCDKILLQRAFTNLIYNAIVHNSLDTLVHISIKKADDRAKIEIRDEGKGIPKEELEKLFIRYYRGTNTGEAHKGSGLGLAIAKQVIEAHQGVISVESTVGAGTKVTVLL